MTTGVHPPHPHTPNHPAPHTPTHGSHDHHPNHHPNHHQGHHHGHGHGPAHQDDNQPLWKRPWIWIMALLLVGLGVGAYVTKQTGDDMKDAKSDTATLIAQIRAASGGWVEGANVFGGELKSLGEGSRHAVLVTKIPNKACVEAGLALAKDGIISVNGVMPPRISAGKLAILCNEGDNASTLNWVPH